MFRYVATSIFLFCAGCQLSTQRGLTTSSKDTREIEIQLTDSLGLIRMELPVRYDTVFSWLQESDCGKPCEEQKYRCQPGNLFVVNETGFFGINTKQDSIDQLTIIHSNDLNLQTAEKTKPGTILQQMRKSMWQDDTLVRYSIDTLLNINNREFAIIGTEGSGVLKRKKITAVTNISNNPVGFEFELWTKREDTLHYNFTEYTLGIIKTIKILNEKSIPIK